MKKPRPRSSSPAVEPLLPVELGPGKIRYALVMRAGRWAFATGHKGTDLKGGSASAVLRTSHPLHDKSKYKRETELIHRNIGRVMRAGGIRFANVVRFQQFLGDLVEFYLAYQVWQHHLPDQYLPFSAIELPQPPPVPDCSVQTDLWVYAP